MVIPGEDSRNKQLREIQQLLASAPIVVNLPPASHSSSASLPVGAQHAAPLQGNASDEAVALGDSPADFSAGASAAQEKDRGASPRATKEHGSRNTDHRAPESPVTSHQSHTLVLPSVPVDQLLDDHAVEFEECKRWANSEAGQSAHMTNPAGFANVRAHAEAHLRAMSQAALAQTPGHPQPKVKGSV